jgi:hypothetical protein
MAARNFLDKIEPHEGIARMNAVDFIAYSFPLYPLQRPINPKRVEQILMEQASHDQFLFVGAFVVAHWRGEFYLMDGQHRAQALRDLYQIEPARIKTLDINICVYVCGGDETVANRIYAQCNSSYTANGNINPKTGLVYTTETDQAKEVAIRIQAKFPKQVGKSSERRAVSKPYFDPNDLMSELNKRGIMKLHSVERVVAAILKENENYGGSLLLTDKINHTKCSHLSGFFLPYKRAGCKWVSQLLLSLQSPSVSCHQ